jgi:phospholipase/carboxylesterase
MNANTDLQAPMLDGPRVAAASGTTRSLVVFLHGYGADGDDLIGLAGYWRMALLDTAFVSPNAPEICRDAPQGRQWFPLAGVDPAGMRDGVVKAAPVLNAFLDAELAHYGLSDEALALVGFSQGSMMALHCGPRRPERIGGIVAYSGLIPGPEYLAQEIRHKPPVLLVHGDQDPLIPAIATYAAGRLLADAGFQVEQHIRPGLGHGIDQEGLNFGADFLRRVLP